MLEQAFVPARRALERRIVTSVLSSPGITKSHGKDCNPRFLQEGRTIHPQPVTQKIAARIIPRYSDGCFKTRTLTTCEVFISI